MHFIAITRRLTERFSDAQFAEHLESEGERARALYAAGSFRALYSRGDKPGAVIEIRPPTRPKPRRSSLRSRSRSTA